MAHIAPIYNYATETIGDSVTFTYKKSQISYKAGLPMMILFGFLSIFITSAFGLTSLGGAVFIWLVFTLSLSFGFIFLLNIGRKNDGKFAVSKDALHVDGNSYPLDHIKTLSIKDPEGGYSTNTYYNVGTLGGSLRNVNAEANNYFKKKLAQTRYKLVARFATKDIVFAKGLSEMDAEVLFDKVCEVTGYSKTS